MSYRGRVKGFYTKNGKRRPITYKHKRPPKIGYNCTKWVVVANPTINRASQTIGKAALGIALKSVLTSIPIVNLIYTGYLFADSFVSNWDKIKKLYNLTKKYASERTITETGEILSKEALSYIQTEVVWKVIEPTIPEGYKEESKSIVREVMGSVTTSEIRFVKEFLSNNQ